MNRIKNIKLTNTDTVIICLIILGTMFLIIGIINNNTNYLSINSLDDEKFSEKSDLDFSAVDFSNYNFSDYDNTKSGFEKLVSNILTSKNNEAINYCNNKIYTDLSNNVNKKIDLSYSYLCNLDVDYFTDLSEVIAKFYDDLGINHSIVDAYIIENMSFNSYANYTTVKIGKSSQYTAYLSRIAFNPRSFSDVDRLKSSYVRDVDAGFHPKGTTVEDIVVHETAHALNFYVEAKLLGIDNLEVSNNESIYQELIYKMFTEQSYSKDLTLRAEKNLNHEYVQNGVPLKSDLEFRKSISTYATYESKGLIYYAETFAEAMTDYAANGDNATDLSIEMHRLLLEDLAKLGV